MNKLKKNAGLKCAAAIVFSVSVVAFIISGILGAYFLDKGVYSPDGRKKLYNQCVEEIAYNYECRAIDFFAQKAALEINNSDKGADELIDSYDDMLMDSDETNFYFDITPTEAADKKKYASISNHEGMNIDYQYSNTVKRDVKVGIDVAFQYSLPLSDIVANCRVIDEDYDRYSSYEDGQEVYYSSFYVDYESDSYGTYEYDEETGLYDYTVTYADTNDIKGYVVTDDHVSYSLADDKEFIKAWEEFCNSYPEFDGIDIYNVSYNQSTGILNVDASFSYAIPVVINEYVASEFTAYDEYYYSPVLNNYKYITWAMDAVLPVLIISGILALITFIYLICAAGHRKGSDEITLNRFDKIPYDVMVLIMCAGFYCIAYAISWLISYRTYLLDMETLVVSAASILTVFLLPAFIMTTATRIKVPSNMFQNMLVWKLIKFVWKVAKKICIKIFGTISSFFHHLNLYWKYIGVLCVAAFIELLACATGNMVAVLIVGFIEFVFFVFVLARAIVNMNALKKGASELASGNTDYEIDTDNMMWEFKQHGENLNRIKDGIQLAVDERMKSERMKTELITNVSHDIKTPLTSIISYVDLLEKENIDNQNAREYLEVLDRQAARLKKLIQDLIEASKASTGNLTVNLEETDVRVLLEQAMGEFTDKLDKRGLKTIITYNTEPLTVMADGQHLWRIFQNLINNITKYAQDNTRVYIDVDSIACDNTENSAVVTKKGMLRVVFKNISKDSLNVTGDELMERFVRGDSSRNTEGSGLGLSIAGSLARLQGGNLEIIVDGDLFKVVLLLVRA